MLYLRALNRFLPHSQLTAMSKRDRGAFEDPPARPAEQRVEEFRGEVCVRMYVSMRFFVCGVFAFFVGVHGSECLKFVGDA